MEAFAHNVFLNPDYQIWKFSVNPGLFSTVV